MMHFIYEEGGITVTMETDATSLYEGYDSGAGVLGHFQRFLAAAGYAIGAEDELTILHEGEVTVDKEHYFSEMEELDELRDAKRHSLLPSAPVKLPFEVFDYLRKWMAIWTHDESIHDSAEVRFEGTRFRSLVDADAAKYTPDEITDCDVKTDDGWIEWHGGECAVSGDTVVEVVFRDGGYDTEIAEVFAWRWLRDGDGGLAMYRSDIIAYRVVDGA